MSIELILEHLQTFGKNFGIQVELLPGALESPYFSYILVLSLLAFLSLWCVTNLFADLFVIYLSENKKVIKLVSKNQIILKFVNFYKYTRKFFVLIEILILPIVLYNILCVTWDLIFVFISITWL